MSLPDAPNTLREKYYSVMAGQNDADILPDIETAPSTENRYLDYIARNGGGGGGGDVSGVKGDAETTYRTGNVNITAANVGAYTKTETDTLLNGKISTTVKGVASGVAELDANGKVPSSQLPAYVDDVINGYYKIADGKFYEESTYETEITGETGKIYVSLDTDKCYRWSGLEYVEISESLALGETSSTAYAGDKGKANADAITAIKDGLTIDSFGDVETALADKVDKVQGKQLSTEDYTTAEKTKLGTVETNATANTVINTSCTLAANGWTGASAPYTQTVNVTDMLATDHATVDLSVSSTTATGIDEIENWAYISKIESGTGTLTFTCYEDKPDIDLNVNIQVVRGTNTGGGSPVETVLYNDMSLSTVAAQNVSYALSQAYTNFDEIRVEYGCYNTSSAGNGRIYPVIHTYTQSELENMRTAQYNERYGKILFLTFSNSYTILGITDTTHFTVEEIVTTGSYNQYITRITGIKY